MTSLRASNATLKDRLTNVRSVLLWPNPTSYTIFKIKRVNGLLFMLTSNGIAVSYDGVNFQLTGDTGSDKLQDIAFGNDTYTAVGNAGQIYTSSGPGSAPDFDWGWVERTAQGDPADDINAVEFTGTHFIIGGDNDLLQRATDGASWALVVPDSGITNILSIAVLGAAVSIVGLGAANTAAVQMSDDHGATFTAQAFDGAQPADMASGMNRVISTGAYLIAAGFTDVSGDNTGVWLQQSTNGAAWTDISSKLVSPALAGQAPIGQQAIPINMTFDDGQLLMVNEWGDVQLSKWNGSSFDNFERIPFLNLPGGISSVDSLGGNYVFSPIPATQPGLLSSPPLGVT